MVPCVPPFSQVYQALSSHVIIIVISIHIYLHTHNLFNLGLFLWQAGIIFLGEPMSFLWWPSYRNMSEQQQKWLNDNYITKALPRMCESTQSCETWRSMHSLQNTQHGRRGLSRCLSLLNFLPGISSCLSTFFVPGWHSAVIGSIHLALHLGVELCEISQTKSTCHLWLPLCRSYLRNHIAEISWLNFPCNDWKIISSRRGPGSLTLTSFLSFLLWWFLSLRCRCRVVHVSVYG